MKQVLLVVGCVVLAGCVAGGGQFYEKRSGKRVDANPALFARFEEHKLQCEAESAKAALSSTSKLVAEHNRWVTTIYHACMAKRGYIVKDT